MGNDLELSDLVAYEHRCGHPNLYPWGIICFGNQFEDGNEPACPTCAGLYTVTETDDGYHVEALTEPAVIPFHLQRSANDNGESE